MNQVDKDHTHTDAYTTDEWHVMYKTRVIDHLNDVWNDDNNDRGNNIIYCFCLSHYNSLSLLGKL